VTASPTQPPPRRGNFYGTGIIGAVDHFQRRYGNAAAHAVIVKLSPHWRELVRPNAPTMGMLGARKYPYPFIGDLFRTMAQVVGAEEDAFIRELTAMGVDLTLNTVARAALRFLVSPMDVARRGQELWDLYHDSGRITIAELGPNGYISQLTDWPEHDVTVCKICMEARRRIVERTGARDVEVRREKCVGWGHEACHVRVRWVSK
jgi:hypothetical protein